MKSLYVILFGFFFFLDSEKEFAYGYFGIILIKSGEKPNFQVRSSFDGVRRETPEQSKATL